MIHKKCMVPWVSEFRRRAQFIRANTSLRLCSSSSSCNWEIHCPNACCQQGLGRFELNFSKNNGSYHCTISWNFSVESVGLTRCRYHSFTRDSGVGGNQEMAGSRLQMFGLCLCEKFAKIEAEKYYSTFRLYVVNIVLLLANSAQKIHLVTYIQTVQQ